MPIRRTFIKNTYQHSIKNDNTWCNVEKSFFDDVVLQLCKQVNTYLFMCFYKVIKPNSVIDGEIGINKKSNHYVGHHIRIWFTIKDKDPHRLVTLDELYSHVSKSIENLHP